MPDDKKKRPHLDIQPQAEAWDEVFRRISWWDSDAMSRAWVMVIGAGALGNEVLKNLALLGVGHIVVMDFDVIEHANLSRSILFRANDCGQPKVEVAAARLREINPEVQVFPLQGDVIYDLGLGLIRRMDVVIGCLDNRVARLHINRHCYKTGTIWIDGGIENLAGRMDVFIPGETCYECQLTEREWSVIKQRMRCTDVAQRNATLGRIPTTPISASIIGARQVQEAMKVIFGNEDKLLRRQRFFTEGMSNEVMFYSSHPLKGFCLSHTTFSGILTTELTHEHTLAATLDHLENLLGDQQLTLLLDYDIVLEVITAKTEETVGAFVPKPRISDAFIRQHEKLPGEGLAIEKGQSTNRLDRSFPRPEMRLSELGIPPLQILTVESSTDIHYVELTGDMPRLMPALAGKEDNKNPIT